MQVLEAAAIARWANDVLLSPKRTRPIVAVTTHHVTGSAWLKAEEVVSVLGDAVDVVYLETGEATWALAEALPPRLDVYGGALRVWWPNLRLESDPYDHRLYLVHSADQARAALQDIAAKLKSDGAASEPVAGQVLDVVVTEVNGARVEVSADGLKGELHSADIPLIELARCLVPGTELRAIPERERTPGHWLFSLRGLLPSPWTLFQTSISENDIVTGRVQNIRPFGAFVEVLPSVVGLVHKSEVDWTFVDDVSEFVTPGQLVAVQCLGIDTTAQQILLSIKRGFNQPSATLPSLVPGGIPFTWSTDEGAQAEAKSPAELLERTKSLEAELDAVVADRTQLAESNRTLRTDAQQLRKQLRASEDRIDALERRVLGELNPLNSETSFLLGVRTVYARLFDEGARREHPLQPLRVGRSFMETLRQLEGVGLEKVLEVCAQVGADTAHEIESREVHQLRSGSAGSPTRTRESDGAQAWRCALQIKTSAARRLHWWRVPGESGTATIEFAAVVLHDDFDIPE